LIIPALALFASERHADSDISAGHGSLWRRYAPS
jgi:hypothetical protein